MIEKKCAHSLVVAKADAVKVVLVLVVAKVSTDPVKAAKGDDLISGAPDKVVKTVLELVAVKTHVDAERVGLALMVVKTRADLAKAIEISRGPSAVVPKEY